MSSLLTPLCINNAFTGDELVDRWRAEAPTAWREAQAELAGVRFSVTVSGETDGKVDPSSSFDILLRFDYDAPFCKITDPSDESNYVRVRNPDYEFVVVPGAEPSTYILDRLKRKGEFLTQALMEGTLAQVEGGWAIGGIRAASLLGDDFVVQRSESVVVDGGSCVRLQFAYSGQDEFEKLQFRDHVLTVDFMPENRWLIHRAVFSHAMTGVIRETRIRTYGLVDNRRVLTSATMFVGDEDQPTATSKVSLIEASFGAAEIRPEEFRLPFYGIPEDSVETKKPIPWLRWIIGIVGCVLLFLGIRRRAN